MDNEIEEALSQLLDSSSDEDDLTFQKYFPTRKSSDDSTAEEEKHAHINNFMDIIDKYSEADFMSHFRLNRSTVEQLITNYSKSDILPSTTIRHGGKPKMGARKEVYLYVWYISNIITFRELGNLFGIAKSSAWTAVGRVSSWLVSKANEYIKWPQGHAVAKKRRKFRAKRRLQGVVGAIDCTNITIAAPKRNKEFFYNRKQNYALVLQAVVDADKKFIDICCGEPGSLNDRKVIRRSTFYKTVLTNHARLFPPNTFHLGDSAN